MADPQALLAAALKNIPYQDGRSDAVKYELTDEQRSALHQMMMTPGYRVLLAIMEGQCLEQELKQINLPIETSAEVVNNFQRTTKAMWLFFIRVQKKARFEISELFQVDEPEVTEDDLLLDPTK